MRIGEPVNPTPARGFHRRLNYTPFLLPNFASVLVLLGFAHYLVDAVKSGLQGGEALDAGLAVVRSQLIASRARRHTSPSTASASIRPPGSGPGTGQNLACAASAARTAGLRGVAGRSGRTRRRPLPPAPPDTLADRDPGVGAAVEHVARPAALKAAQRGDMDGSEVGDLDVVAHAGPVRRRLVGAAHGDSIAQVERSPLGGCDQLRAARA